MRTQLSKLALAAAFGLALTFTFSCSSDDDGGGGGNSGGGTCNGSSGINGGNGKGNNIANYKTKRIGDQVWMAENLNYNVTGSRCYGECGQVFVGMNENEEPIMATLSNTEIKANCEKYGRLYDWATAKDACPTDYHLPSREEWDELIKVAGGAMAGRILKSTKMAAVDVGKGKWPEGGFGVDTYGFSALPGGERTGDFGHFNGVGGIGYWWTSTKSTGTNIYYKQMAGNKDEVEEKDYTRGKDGYSVRCIHD